MGKGDRRTRTGKIWMGSHGKTRSRKKEKLRSKKRAGQVKEEPSQTQA